MPLQIEDEPKREVRSLLAIRCGSVGDLDAKVAGLRHVNSVEPNAVTGNDLQPFEPTDDACGQVIVTKNDGVGVSCEVEHLGLCERSSIGVEPNFAASSLETFDRLIRATSKGHSSRANNPVGTHVILRRMLMRQRKACLSPITPHIIMKKLTSKAISRCGP